MLHVRKSLKVTKKASHNFKTVLGMIIDIIIYFLVYEYVMYVNPCANNDI